MLDRIKTKATSNVPMPQNQFRQIPLICIRFTLHWPELHTIRIRLFCCLTYFSRGEGPCVLVELVRFVERDDGDAVPLLGRGDAVPDRIVEEAERAARNGTGFVGEAFSETAFERYTYNDRSGDPRRPRVAPRDQRDRIPCGRSARARRSSRWYDRRRHGRTSFRCQQHPWRMKDFRRRRRKMSTCFRVHPLRKLPAQGRRSRSGSSRRRSLSFRRCVRQGKSCARVRPPTQLGGAARRQIGGRFPGRVVVCSLPST